MAANSKSRGIANLGKRLISNNQIWTRDPAHCSLLLPAVFTLRRAVHSSYEKNMDEHTHHTAVPDELIQPQSDKYWTPHPQTGVFGPDAVDSASATANGKRGFLHSALAANAGSDNADSVLEQQAWFRPASMEDLEKPHGLH